MYNILETENHGFSKSCKHCVEENAWRSTMLATAKDEVGRATRLTVDSVRPFDGFLGRYIERLAHEIYLFKIAELEQSIQKENIKDIYIPLLIEENAFEFEESLVGSDLKGTNSKKRLDSLTKTDKKMQDILKKKMVRIQNTSGFCPYCGSNIINGEIDHIIPRSYSQKKYNTTFNSEANLIYCCRDCNQSKQDKIYVLDDINEKHLQDIFQTSDVDDIIEQINLRLGNILRDFKNFAILSQEEKNYVRYGLFVEKFRGQIIGELNTRTKTLVNGTQAYLSKLIREKLLHYCAQRDINICIYPFFISPVDDEYRLYNQDKNNTQLLIESSAGQATRKLLSLENPEFMKEEKQAYLSHVIDASMVLGTALRAPEYFLNILRKDIFARYLDIDELLGDLFMKHDFSSSDNLATLVPSSPSITHVMRRQDSQNYWTQPRFNDSIYSEEYYPVIIGKQGVLYYGYMNPETSKKFFEPIKKPTKKQPNNEHEYNLLAEFLTHKKINVIRDDKSVLPLQDLIKMMKTKEIEYLFFKIDKHRVGDYYYTLFYGKAMQNLNDNEISKVKFLDKLRKGVFLKKPLLESFEKLGEVNHKNYSTHSQQALFQKVENIMKEILFEEYEIAQQAQKIIEKHNLYGKGNNKEIRELLKKESATIPKYFMSKGKYFEKKDIKKLFDILRKFHSDKKYFSVLTNKKKVDLFLQFSSSDRLEKEVLQQRNVDFPLHHKKTKYKINIIPQKLGLPGATFRIQRKDHLGNTIYQIITKNEAYVGIMGEKKVLHKVLSQEKKLVPISDFLQTCPYPVDRELTEEERTNKDFVTVNIPLHIQNIKLIRIEELKYSKQGKGYVRFYLSLESFKSFYKSTWTKVRDEDKIKDIVSIYTVPNSFTLDKKKLYHILNTDYTPSKDENNQEKNVTIICKVEPKGDKIQLTIENRGDILKPFGL